MTHDDLNPKDLEDLVLGQVLYEPDCISRAMRFLKPEHFFGSEHRAVYEVVVDMWRQGFPIDLFTVAHNLMKIGKLKEVGGPPRLAGWVYHVAKTIHLEYHCAIIREQYGLRVLRDTGLRLSNTTNATEDPDSIIAAMNTDIAKASGFDMGSDLNAGEVAYEMMNAPEPSKPLRLGITGLDDYVFILEDNMIVFTAPSGVGKTATVMTAVMNIIQVRKPWVVSLEMSAKELITRILCGYAKVEIQDALNNSITAEDRSRLAQAANEHADTLAKLDIYDDGHMTIDQFKAMAEHKVRNEGVGLIAIDYGQLMDADRSQYKNSTEKYEVISRGIKATTKALKVPIFLIVQLNKDGEIYGSGQFEKDAHVVVKLSKDPSAPNVMQYEISKNRNGRTGAGNMPCALAYGIVGSSGEPPSFNPALPTARGHQNDTPF